MGFLDKFIDKRPEYNIYGLVGAPGVRKVLCATTDYKRFISEEYKCMEYSSISRC